MSEDQDLLDRISKIAGRDPERLWLVQPCAELLSQVISTVIRFKTSQELLHEVSNGTGFRQTRQVPHHLGGPLE